MELRLARAASKAAVAIGQGGNSGAGDDRAMLARQGGQIGKSMASQP